MDLFKRAIQKYYTDSEDDTIDAAYEIIKDEPFDTYPIGKAFKLFLMASSQKEHIGINEELEEFSKNQKNPPAEAVFFMRDAFIAAGSVVSANNIVLRHFNVVVDADDAKEDANADDAKLEDADDAKEVPITPVAPIEEAEEAEEEITAPKFPKLTRQDNFPPANTKGGSKSKGKGKGIKGKGHKTRRASSQQKQPSKRKA